MSIASYFKPLPKPQAAPVKRKVGRPSQKDKEAESATKRAVAAAEEEMWEKAVAVQEAIMAKQDAEVLRRTQKRDAGHVNWSLEENVQVMAVAVQGWLDGSAKKNGYSLRSWADVCKVPVGTLSNYTTSNLEKRKALGGSGPGLPSHLSDVQVSVVVEAIVRADRGQQPKSMFQIIETIQELNGGLSRRQARDVYAKTILPAHGDRLTGLVTAQPTTTARSAITISQQFRWHTLVSSLYQEIVQLNTHESGCDAEDVPPS